MGCCTLGAHFADKADEKRVASYVDQLGPDLWQFHPGGKVRKSDWIEKDDEGERKTKVVEQDGQSACVFHNRQDFPTGAGCPRSRCSRAATSWTKLTSAGSCRSAGPSAT